MKKILIGFIISFLGLYFAFRKLDFNSLYNILKSVDWFLISGSIFIMIFSVLIRAMRWQILLKPIDNFRVYNLFISTIIGYFGNSVLPFRLGELLRANVLNKMYNSISIPTAFATIAVERFLDLVGAFFIIIILITTNEVPIWFQESFLVLIFVIFTLLIFILFFANSKKDFLLNDSIMLNKNVKKKINLTLNNFRKGLTEMKNIERPFSLLLYTFLLWFLYWSSVWLCVIATDINISFFQAGIILFATGMVIAIPSAPGYVGTFHATVFLILSDFFLISVDKSHAFAILNHFVGFIPMVIIGGIFFLKSSINLTSIKEK